MIERETWVDLSPRGGAAAPDGFLGAGSGKSDGSDFDGLLGLARGLGFEFIAYVARMPFQVCDPMVVVRSNFPKPWQDRHRSGSMADLDPAIRRAMDSPEPIVWNEVCPDVHGDPYRPDAGNCGANHGWSKSTYDPCGMVSVFTVARSHGALQPDELQDKLPHLLWLAQLGHVELGRHIQAESEAWTAPIRLSVREREVLRYSADGRTVAEVAHLTQLTERTVSFHVNNAMAKLGARNKTHAAVLAVRLGLLS